MKTTNLTYDSHDGSTVIRAWLKEPDKVASGKQLPRAVVQVIHGAAEHSGRYAHMAKYLVDKGFVVCAHDQIGHGASAASADDLGQMPLVGGLLALVEDVHSLRRLVQPRYLESVPYVMLGHSMGSYVLRVYLSDHGQGLSAAVLIGTSQPSQLKMDVSRMLARRIARRSGERSFNDRLHRLGLGGVGKKMKDKRTEFDWISSDPDVVDAYIADPISGFRFSNGAYATLSHLMRDMMTSTVLSRTPKGLSVLVLSGAEDPLSDRGRAARGLAQAYRAAGIASTDFKVYHGMRHELLNEPERRGVLDDIIDWLERRIGV
jgi:alpha-beta hydrolase superfamily lysophospholipase